MPVARRYYYDDLRQFTLAPQMLMSRYAACCHYYATMVLRGSSVDMSYAIRCLLILFATPSAFRHVA